MLLFDRRGEGESEGDPNIFGWEGERDIHAAVEYLQSRPDVDPDRIGGIGLSVGGEMMIQAAAESPALRAIVSEGASGRSVRDELREPGLDGWSETRRQRRRHGSRPASSAATCRRRRSQSLVPKISGAVFFVYGEHGQPAEKPANPSFYAARTAARSRSGRCPGRGTPAASTRNPREYERRVVGFFDRTLLAESK